jgi:hypothetical protein
MKYLLERGWQGCESASAANFRSLKKTPKLYALLILEKGTTHEIE